MRPMCLARPAKPHALRWQAVAALALGLALLGQAGAQTVGLAGLTAGKALLVVDGAAPRFLSPGQTLQNVRLLSVTDQEAVVEREGQRQTLRLGESPVSLAPAAVDRRIVLSADNGGHFSAQGNINGKTVLFLVDTGATALTLSEAEARHLGLNLAAAERVRVRTANGELTGHRLTLEQVRLGQHVSYNVAAVVLPAPMPFVLLGNSFLARFDLRRENDRMILEPRY